MEFPPSHLQMTQSKVGFVYSSQKTYYLRVDMIADDRIQASGMRATQALEAHLLQGSDVRYRFRLTSGV